MPTQRQLMLPLMRAIENRGGAARSKDVYDDIAEELGIPDDLRDLSRTFAGSGTSRSLFERQVRWTRQTATLRGYLATPERGVWELTDLGKTALRNVRPGVIITVFETANGMAIAANAEAAAGILEPESVDLLFTSPPFPLLSGKEYGTSSTAAWLEWMLDLAADWKTLLAPTGSIIMHLGECYYRGMPVQSQYIERLCIKLEDELGLYRAGRLYWENPARLPDLQWAAIHRVRVRSTVDPLLWFSKSPNPKADNRRVLEPYAERTRRQYIDKDFTPVDRPSGLSFGEKSWSKDNGGKIPSSIIRCGNASGMDSYSRACRAAGLKIHPARMPQALAEFAIKLTTEKGDLVVDPFFGSGTTGAAAEALGRYWLGLERSLTYLDTSGLRFESAPGFQVHGNWREAAR